jgi:hypothetical protein
MLMSRFDLYILIDEPLVERRLVLKTCPYPTRVFTGRQSVIDQMHAYFSSNIGMRHIFVLYGLGGAGKSQIAYKFIEESQFDMDPSRYDTSRCSHALTLTSLQGSPKSLSSTPARLKQ